MKFSCHKIERFRRKLHLYFPWPCWRIHFDNYANSANRRRKCSPSPLLTKLTWIKDCIEIHKYFQFSFMIQNDINFKNINFNRISPYRKNNEIKTHTKFNASQYFSWVWKYLGMWSPLFLLVHSCFFIVDCTVLAMRIKRITS